MDRAGNLYITDVGNKRIRKVNSEGVITSSIAATDSPEPGLLSSLPANFGFQDHTIGPDGMVYIPGSVFGVNGPPLHAIYKVDSNGATSSTSLPSHPNRGVIDSAGNYFFSSYNYVYKLTPGGQIEKIAGAGPTHYTTGQNFFSGDGGPATEALLNGPTGLAIDAQGNLYIADSGNMRVRKIFGVAAPGLIAGGPFPEEASRDTLPPVTTAGTAYHSEGDVYSVTVTLNSLDAESGVGELTYSASGAQTLAPTTVASHSASLKIDRPGETTVEFFARDQKGNVEPPRSVVVHVLPPEPSHLITTVAGSGPVSWEGWGSESGDGGPALEALLRYPSSLAIDASGYVYLGSLAGTLRRLSLDGSIHGVIPTLEKALADVVDVALGPGGDLYVAHPNTIHKIDPNGVLTRVAGRPTAGSSPRDLKNLSSGNAGLALDARLFDIGGIALDSQGTLYISEGSHLIRKVDPDGIITTVAGVLQIGANGEPQGGYSGDGVAAAQATLSSPRGLTVDRGGNLYIADRDNHRVRRIAPDGTITTVAGTGPPPATASPIEPYPLGDGGPATAAQLYRPNDVAVDSSGTLYIADLSNHRIRRIDPQGRIATVAGGFGNFFYTEPRGGFSGDGGPATRATLDAPLSLAIDPSGNLLIADATNHRIRKVEGVAAPGLLAGQPFSAGAPDAVPPLLRANAERTPAEGGAINVQVTLHAYDFKPGVKEITYSAEGDHPLPVTTVPTRSVSLSFPGTGKTFLTYYATDTDGNRSEAQTMEIPPSEAAGVITTVAGRGTLRGADGQLVPGPAGLGGLAIGARLASPRGITFDEKGDLYTHSGSLLRLDRFGVLHLMKETGSGGALVADGKGSLY